ncbi:MAG TPA: L,D-transpeptidase family protein [Hyphomicrobiaceae bacterium]|nr:L,D-transpeptidase family protein [Hyphomicrobiaceae bacterium]
MARRRTLIVRALSAGATRGTVELGPLRFRCALGRSGRRVRKREGDGATPVGRFLMQRVLYRPDRCQRPRTGLKTHVLRPTDGWCDCPRDRNYNRPVRLPYPASAEAMWRADELYDLVVVLSHNCRPRVKGLGSAIFLHVAAPGLAPTQGCIALRRADLMRLLAQLSRGSSVWIRG